MNRQISQLSHRERLRLIAVDAMRARGLEPDLPADAVAQAAALSSAPTSAGEPIRDLRSMLWCSIDNDDSMDLDQLPVLEALGAGTTRRLVPLPHLDPT